MRTRKLLITLFSLFIGACSGADSVAPISAPPMKQDFVMAIVADGGQDGYIVGAQMTRDLADGLSLWSNFYGNTVYMEQKGDESVALVQDLFDAMKVEAVSFAFRGKLRVDTSSASSVRLVSYINYARELVVRYAGQNQFNQERWDVYGDSSKMFVTAVAAEQVFRSNAREPNLSSVEHAFGVNLRCVKPGTTYVTVEQDPTINVKFRLGMQYAYRFTPVRIIQVSCYAGESLPSSVRIAMEQQKLSPVRTPLGDSALIR